MSARFLPAWRRFLAFGLLAVVAVFEIRALRIDDAGRRLTMVARQLRGERIPRSERTGFYFDSGYSDFLEEVARRTPREATVAVVVPQRPDLYRYQAVYVLAPRRVVEEGQMSEAHYVAIYGRRWERGAVGRPLPNGTLLAR